LRVFIYRKRLCRIALSGLLILVTVLLSLRQVTAAPVAVRFVEGVTHGFLVLRNLNGGLLASGDLLQVQRGDGSRVAWYSASRMARYTTRQWCSLRNESLPCRATTWYSAGPLYRGQRDLARASLWEVSREHQGAQRRTVAGAQRHARPATRRL
jgi:hypothetical protein